MSLADAHRESRARSSWSIQRGRPFGEQGSILCGQSRVRGRDPPVFSAGSTGKSLITYSSIRHGVGRGKTTGVLPRQVLPFVDQKPKCGSGAGVVYLLLSVRGVRVPRLGLGVRVKRTVRFQEVVEITGCGGRAENQPSLQQFPRGRSGEKYLDPRGAGPGEQGSRPQVSRQRKPW